jgi:hypothetical protein
MSDVLSVKGAWADRYRAFRDLYADLWRDRALYRGVVLQNPSRADAQTIAVVLSGQVQFVNGARDVFQRAFDADDHEDGAMLFASLRPYLKVLGDARQVIEAYERAAATSALAEACVYLFIHANERTVEIEEPVELPSEESDDGDDDDDDAGSLPDESQDGGDA